MPALLAQFLPQGMIRYQQLKMLPEIVAFTLPKYQPSIANDIGNLAGIRTDDGHLTGHGLDQNPPELLLPVRPRERGKDKAVHAIQVAGNFQRWNLVYDMNPLVDAKTVCLLQNMYFIRAVADNQQPGVLVKLVKSVHEGRKPLFLDEPAHVSNDEVTALETELEPEMVGVCFDE